MLWKLSQLAEKEEMAKQLLAHEEELSADFHGSIVLRNCNMAHFKKKQAGWLEQQRAADKKRELFQDLLEGPSQPAVDSVRNKKRKRVLDDDDGTLTVNKKRKKG